jgi:hypothetical protein
MVIITPAHSHIKIYCICFEQSKIGTVLGRKENGLLEISIIVRLRFWNF